MAKAIKDKNNVLTFTDENNTLKLLEESEEKYRLIVENEKSLICKTDIKGYFLFVNTAYCKYFEKTENELLGKTFYPLVHPDDIPVVEKAVAQLFTEPYECTYEERVSTKHGWRWLSWTAKSLLNEKGEVIAFIGSAQDITEKKEIELENLKILKYLKESEEKYHALVDNAFEGIVITDFGGTIIFVNKSIGRIFEIPDINFLLGRNVFEFISPDYHQKATDDFINVISGKDSYIGEYLSYSITGKEIWLECIGKLITFNGKPADYISLRDITRRKESEKELKNTIERNQALLDAIPDMMFVIDRDSKIIAFHSNNRSHLYVQPEFFIGKRIKDVLPPDVASLMETKVSEVFKTGLPEYTTYALDINGEIRHFESRGVLCGINETLSIIRDITTQKRTETIRKIQYNIANSVIVSKTLEGLISDVQKELSQLIDTSNFFVALYDEKTDMLSAVLWKDEKDSYTKWPAKNSVSGVVVKKEKTLILNKLDMFKLAEEENIELIGTKSEQWLGVPLRTSNKIIGAMVVQSYHNNKAFDEESKEIMETIANQLGFYIEKMRQQEELIKAKQKAEESDRLKSAFLANMSHEIRTPMNGILGFISLLEQPDLTSEQRDRYIKILNKSGERLINTINDIIDISKIESGLSSLSVSEVDINQQINYIYSFFQPEAAAKNLSFLLINTLSDISILIKTDKYKLNSILNNLIKNALKFTDTGSIELGCFIHNANLEFYVKDTGIGISKDRQSIIFERFIQVDSSPLSRAYEGSGLGLTISKAYTEMLGGQIWLESEPDQGATFHLIIPHNLVTDKIILKIPETRFEIKSGENQIKILVTEDDDVNFDYIKIVLSGSKFTILHAKTGIEAVQLCQMNNDLALILMDVKLPVMDGFSATKKIREFNPDIPIIAITAYALSGDREKALDSGCNDYLSKPIRKNDLINSINKYLHL